MLGSQIFRNVCLFQPGVRAFLGKACFRLSFIRHRFDVASGLTLSLPLILSACSADVVPVNANLRITPDSHSTEIVETRNNEGQCLYYTDNHVDIPILMELTTNGGSPIGDAELHVYADFAGNTYTGVPVMTLFDDLNGNGVVDAANELISGNNDDIAKVKTGQWTGSRALLLRLNLSCEFRGELVVFTGGVSARASIEVVSQNDSDIHGKNTRGRYVD